MTRAVRWTPAVRAPATPLYNTQSPEPSSSALPTCETTIEDEDLYTQTEDESTVNIRRNPGKQPEKPAKPKTLYERVEARLKAWGVEEICVGEPLKIIESLAEDGRAFDAVLDTVGGADVWEASQKLLLADPLYDTVRNPPTSPASPAGSSVSGATSTQSNWEANGKFV